MKIYRLADSDDGGYIVVEFRVTKDGKYRETVLEHGNGASCHNEDDQAIVRAVKNKRVKGYGNVFGEAEDEGKTPEYYESITDAPISESPEGESPFEEDQVVRAPTKKKDLDLGFGV